MFELLISGAPEHSRLQPAMDWHPPKAPSSAGPDAIPKGQPLPKVRVTQDKKCFAG